MWRCHHSQSSEVNIAYLNSYLRLRACSVRCMCLFVILYGVFVSVCVCVCARYGVYICVCVSVCLFGVYLYVCVRCGCAYFFSLIQLVVCLLFQTTEAETTGRGIHSQHPRRHLSSLFSCQDPPVYDCPPPTPTKHGEENSVITSARSLEQTACSRLKGKR